MRLPNHTGLLVCAATVVSCMIGGIDFGASEVQGTVLLLLVASTTFSFVRPRLWWLWSLVVGLGVPAWHLGSLAVGLHPAHPAEPNALATLIALIPALIGGGIGAALRSAFSSPQTIEQ